VLFSLDNLTKRFGALEALAGLTVDVERGAVGLLGPNGAGKTTLIKLLLGLLEPSSGTGRVLGHRLPDEAQTIRQKVGYMPENDCHLPYLSAVDFVTMSGRLSGMPKSEAFRRAHQVLHYVGLAEARYRELSGFSAGMKQRVKLAQAIVHGPELVFLDEPTSELDPSGRDEMLELIEDIKSRGIGVVLSSHLLHEVEQVCDAVLMLDQGRLVHYGPLSELKSGGGGRVEIRTREQDDKLASALRTDGFEVDHEGRSIEVQLGPDESPRQLLEAAVESGVQIRHFMPQELTLETAFLQLLDGEDSRPSRDHEQPEEVP
jgi:ABC-2 type transport system ATP-binding protein